MKKEDIIKIIQSIQVRKYLNRHGIKHISLFWSYLKWQQNKTSDIDLIYEQEVNKDIWLEYFTIINYLQKKLWKKIDFVEIKYINKHLKEDILKNKLDII